MGSGGNGRRAFSIYALRFPLYALPVYHRPEHNQNPFKMWLITIACCVAAFAIGLIIVSALV